MPIDQKDSCATLTNTVISINPQAEIFANVQYSWKWRHVNMQGTLRTLIVGKGLHVVEHISFTLYSILG